jgi:hypothetical protein
MDHSILKDLPALHATFIGLGGSLFGVYALLSIERNYGAEEQMELALQELKKLTQYADRIKISEAYFHSDGEPDWSSIWNVRNKLLPDCDPLEGIKRLYDFLSVLSSLLFKYRFSNDEDKGFFKLLSDDSHHCDGFMYMLQSMSVFMEKNKSALLNLAVGCDSNRLHFLHAEEKAFREAVDRGEGPKKTEDYEGRDGMLFIDYSHTLSRFVDLINAYLVLVPKLRTSLQQCELWDKRLPLKRYSIVALMSALALIVIGIMLPLILVHVSEQNLDLCKKYSLCWNAWYEYLILGMSFAPYFIFIGFILNKVLKVNGR